MVYWVWLKVWEGLSAMYVVSVMFASTPSAGHGRRDAAACERRAAVVDEST